MALEPLTCVCVCVCVVSDGLLQPFLSLLELEGVPFLHSRCMKKRACCYIGLDHISSQSLGLRMCPGCWQSPAGEWLPLLGVSLRQGQV